MSTVIEFPSATDARIAGTVRGLISGQRRDVGTVATAIGVSRAALYQKIKGKGPFKASEVEALAALLGVTIDDLYTGLDGKFTPPTLPRLDSNQKPAGNRPPLSLVGHIGRQATRRVLVPAA